MIGAMQFQRVLLIVMDGCGAGVAPDAAEYGDPIEAPGDTLVHVAQAVGGLSIPNLRRIGLGNALALEGGKPVARPCGGYGRLREKSRGGKDTVTGHWEMMGIVVDRRFPTYPDGFPPEVVEPFEKAIGRKVLGNRAASGTTIIKELGEEHLATGHPILYTSADSVFQVACNEAVVPVDELYRICRKARGILTGDHPVQRVIARPFEGDSAENFRRTERRKDFPLAPPENVLDRLAEAGVFVSGIGVIPEVFDERGFVHKRRTQTNKEHFEATMELLDKQNRGFFFINFEDFDMLYGHRNDPEGFAKALEVFDRYLGHIMMKLHPSDLLLVCADHGNDPTTPGTDHTREYSPLLVYSPAVKGGRDYGDRETFADLGETVLDAFKLEPLGVGCSLLA